MSFMVITSCLSYVRDFKKDFNSASTPTMKRSIIVKYRRMLQRLEQSNERCPGLRFEIDRKENEINSISEE